MTYLSVAHNLLFSFISFPFIHSCTVSYSSPLTGKRYNVDYRANWNFQAPPVTFKPITLTIPHPASVISMFKPFNFNANWDYNVGNNHENEPATSYGPPSPPPKSTTKSPHNTQHTFNKQFNWDLNWNFNHGSSSSLGAATDSHEKEEAPVSTTTTLATTTTTTTTSKPVSNTVNSNGVHGEKRINIEWSLNVNHGTSSSSSSSGNAAPSTKLQPPNKASSDFKTTTDDDFDDGFGDDESKNDAKDES